MLTTDCSLLFPRHQLRHTFFLNRLVIMQHTHRWKRAQQLIRLEQEHRVAGAGAAEMLLLRGVCLINQKPARLDGRSQGREELALQKEKDKNQIVLLPSEVLLCIQISN